MAKAQKKEVRGKQHKVQRKLKAPASSATRAVNQREVFWQDEIKGLKSQKFGSLNDAIEAVVDRALDRYKGQLGKSTGMRNFLIETISDSPEVITQLRSALKICE